MIKITQHPFYFKLLYKNDIRLNIIKLKFQPNIYTSTSNHCILEPITNNSQRKIPQTPFCQLQHILKKYFELPDYQQSQHQSGKTQIIMQKNTLLNNPVNNPAQNISINISYNLNTTNKLPKQIIQNKKISKTKKINTANALHGIGNQFFSQLAINSLQTKTKQLRKQNQSKKSNQPSNQNKQSTNKKVPTKKKKPQSTSTNKQAQLSLQQQHQTIEHSDNIPEYYNPLASNAKHFLKRNIQSPDIFRADVGRKMKTEGSMYDDVYAVGKKKRAVSTKEQGSLNTKTFKNPKSNNFFKQPINNCQILSTKAQGSYKTMPKKLISSSKTPKSKQRQSFTSKPKRIHTQESDALASQGPPPQYRQNKSCMLYSTKKALPQNIITEPHLIETASNIMSQYMSVNSTKGRKRAQSAYIFANKDKELVSKLLNMSMISSELGSSQLITSERMRSGRSGSEMARKQLGLKVDELDSFNKVKSADYKKQQQTVYPGNALRQYLNSIDLRIIKSIESDTANIVQANQLRNKQEEKSNIQVNFGKKPKSQFNNSFSNQPYQQYTFSQKIPAKKETQILSVLQDQSQKQGQNSDVVSFYSKLFTNALQNKLLEQKQKYVQSANGSDIMGDLHEGIKKQRFMVQGFDDIDHGVHDLLREEQISIQYQKQQKESESSSSDNSDNELYEFVNKKPSAPTSVNPKSSNPMKLNFQHYKEILQSHKQQYNSTKLAQNEQIDFQLVSCEQENSIKTQEIQKNLLEESEEDELESPLKYLREERVEMWNSDMMADDVKKQGYMKDEFIQDSKDQADSYVQETPPSSTDPQILIKSPPKQPTRQKMSHMREPEYTEICWQYNEQEFQKQLNSQNRRQGEKGMKFLNIDRGLTSSPTNNSDLGSGDEEYDSKKYSVKEDLGKDGVVQDSDENKTAEKLSAINQGWKVIQNLTTSLIQNESDQFNDDQLSCEDREIGTTDRWVNPAFCQLKQSPQPSKQSNKNDENYLQCSLSTFGVKQQQQHIQRAITQHVQNNKKNAQPQQKHATEQVPVIQLEFDGFMSSKRQNQQSPEQKEERVDPFSEIRKKRLTHIVQDIILELIRQFAKDISYILKKSSTEKLTHLQFEENTSPLRVGKNDEFLHENELSPFSRDEQMFGLGQQLMNDRGHENMRNQRSCSNNNIKKSQFVGKCFGIDTSFISVQRYLRQFKQFVMCDQKTKQSIIKNINKDIGPNSLQILSYLRPQYDNLMQGQMQEQNEYGQMVGANGQGIIGGVHANQQQQEEEEDGLFVVPSQAFSEFQSYLEQQLQEKNKLLQPQKQMVLTQKQKRNTNFWHRGIYQSWNQFLDYERPYGINGKPYQWIRERKKYRQVKVRNVQEKLQRGIDKLLQAISLPSGIIYDKFQMSPLYMDLSQEQKIYLNQERLSRMLAIELFQSQDTWINYNDQMAELLVQLSRVIQERVFFQMATEVKRLERRRKFQGMGVQHAQEGNKNINQTDQLQKEGLNSGEFSEQQEDFSS